MSLVQTVIPTTLPVSISDLKLELRLDGNDADEHMRQLIERATAYAQQYQWSQLITGTFAQRMNCLPGGGFVLHRGPSAAVTSITYVDTAGVTQTLSTSDYTVDGYSIPARVVPAWNVTWPAVRGHINDVVVTFTAGYGSDPSNIPADIKTGILLHAKAQYEGCDEMSAMIKAANLHLDKQSFRVFY